MKYQKKYFGQSTNSNDNNLSGDNIGDPASDGDLLLVAMLIWIAIIVIVFLLFVYMLYDFVFVGTPVIRVLFGIIIFITLGLYLHRRLSKARPYDNFKI